MKKVESTLWSYRKSGEESHDHLLWASRFTLNFILGVEQSFPNKLVLFLLNVILFVYRKGAMCPLNFLMFDVKNTLLFDYERKKSELDIKIFY